ncbi:nucleotide sugar dehydrogenase [Bacillus tequilensis]|uniref:nucleotide sugar dehydrogenase n=1 Tax=Bacillus tequilensis TaxID=227866 RepID=UPI001576A245|nr:nucleotide sugar dehydrogenase [Bacillus tequilensis]NTU24943.1 nucleotide sugar dehydrogenase [Bacillus tequilensis]
MNLYKSLRDKKFKVSVVGLGYVGLPLAISLGKYFKVIGFDISEDKIKNYLKGKKYTYEVEREKITNSDILFTYNEKELLDSRFHIIAVPTPINLNKTPDLSPLKEASAIVGRNLKKDSIVVYESTVYPGVTEEICAPILEKESGLKCGIDFKIGYSPERINPGDNLHNLEKVTKVVSGMDRESLNIISQVYKTIVKAGVYRAKSIKVAESAKVIENSQRDINIAFMNELSIIFNKMGIDTKSVLEAAKTKWNFIDFSPGLVGGHCIGIDPYYLTYKAEEIGYHSQIILAGRKVNDSMGKYVAENTIKMLLKAGKNIKGARIAVFGVTFKENCPDIRNSLVVNTIRELKEYETNIKVVDPIANAEDLWNEYRIKLNDINDIKNMDCIIFAVPHNIFKSFDLTDISNMYRINVYNNIAFEAAIMETATSSEVQNQNYEINIKKNTLIDLKGIFNREEVENKNFLYWRL